MTFDDWWEQNSADLTWRVECQAAWDAAVAAERERCAKVADAYAAGFEDVQRAEGRAWCPKCGEYTRNVADDIAESIRGTPVAPPATPPPPPE